MTLKNTDIFKITVINRQTIDGESDTVNEIAKGTYREKNGKYFIAYKNEGITSMIKVADGIISVKRIGDINSNMIFILNENTEFDYNTKYGAVTMKIFTEKILSSLSDDGGKIKLRYLLKTGGDNIINDMTIKVKRI